MHGAYVHALYFLTYVRGSCHHAKDVICAPGLSLVWLGIGMSSTSITGLHAMPHVLHFV